MVPVSWFHVPALLIGRLSHLFTTSCMLIDWLSQLFKTSRKLIGWLGQLIETEVYWLVKVAMVYWADWDNKKGLISGLRIRIYWSANPFNWLRLSVCWLAFSISWLSPRASWLVKLIVGWSSSQPASWLVSCQPVGRFGHFIGSFPLSCQKDHLSRLASQALPRRISQPF